MTSLSASTSADALQGPTSAQTHCARRAALTSVMRSVGSKPLERQGSRLVGGANATRKSERNQRVAEKSFNQARRDAAVLTDGRHAARGRGGVLLGRAGGGRINEEPDRYHTIGLKILTATKAKPEDQSERGAT
jgi:hypothetical protein